jgi:hypothetical protein
LTVAIYHLHVQTIGRSGGQSAVAAAAYRSTSCLLDERTGETHDYTRKEKALKSGIELPPGAPEWAGNRLRLWNEVEKKENRKNSILAYEMNVAIPAELEKPDQEKLIRTYCRTITEKGLACDWSIHAPAKDGDQRNIHAHIMFTTRKFENGGWSRNKIQMDREEYSDFINEKRADWEKCANAALKELYENQKWEMGRHRKKHKDEYGFYPRNGESENGQFPKILKIDRRTLAAQGIDREPQRHQGQAATAVARKEKRESAGWDKERELKEAETALYLIGLAEGEWDKELPRLEKKIRNTELRAQALAVKDYLPEIEKAQELDGAKIRNEADNLRRKTPGPIAEKKRLSFLYTYTDDSGMAHKSYESYAEAQGKIIA